MTTQEQPAWSKNAHVTPGLNTPVVKTEVADFASSDHEFETLPKGLYVSIGPSGGNLVMKLPGDDSDLTVVIAVTGYHPWSPTHIRMSSTVTAVIGLME